VAIIQRNPVAFSLGGICESAYKLGIETKGNEVMENEFIKLAAYNYKRAAYHEANGNATRARLCLETAQQYENWAQTESN